MKKETLNNIARARSQLMLDHPFFGYLTCMLKPRAEKIGTFATNGKELIIDEEFAAKLSLSEFKFIFAHEVLHVALDHLTRRGAREPQLWNMAIDFAANDILVNEGFQMPTSAKGLHDPDFHRKSAEEIYNLLLKEDGKGKHYQTFDVHIFDGMGQKELEAAGVKSGLDNQAIKDLKDAMILAANIARSQGKCPAAISEMVDGLVNPKINWRRLLIRFLSTIVTKNDYSYRRLHRGYMAQGVAIPTLRNQTIEPVGIALDTSGSISNEDLKQFMSEVQSFAKMGWSFDVNIFINDAELHDYYKMNAKRIDYKKIKITGRGGTDFKPVFEKIARDNIRVSCLIFMTDCEGGFPDRKPKYPVLWVKPHKNNAEVPFGSIINMEK